jgi:hypothetical protein
MNADGTPKGDVEGMAQAIAAGKLPGLSGFALARPRGQAVMARVMEINPNYDAGDYLAKNQALRGFSTGKEGTALRSFNVAVTTSGAWPNWPTAGEHQFPGLQQAGQFRGDPNRQRGPDQLRRR